ncbi:MAG: SPOR domain-containing protein [Alistipes sp.]
MIRKIYWLLGVALLTTGALYSQQRPPEPRIEGLEGNAAYMSLLREDAQLQSKEDSVVHVVERLRQLLRENPAAQQQHAQEILQFENRIFEIRNAKGRLIDRINTIEQEWVLNSLNGAAPKRTEPVVNDLAAAIPDSLKVRCLVDNPYFRQQLPAADYAALQRAQQQEMLAVSYVNRYFANYHTAAELAASYAAVAAEQEALDLQGKYNTLQGLNAVLADSLATTWNYIFDNKSYAYGYLLDKSGHDDILIREEERLSAATQQLATLREEVVSETIADYFLRKRVLVDYEMSVAGVLGLETARDSLRGVATQLAAIDSHIPKIELVERNFLDYDSLSFSAVSKYSYQHPIPECRIHARGTIYRVLLGTFNTKRAAEVFRGTSPLSYLINEANKWCYYAGGFATKAEAELALKQLKARGFSRPEIVVWVDGVATNLAREPEAQSLAYRVEIKGAEALSDAMKQLITENAQGAELSRVGQQLFVVGAFDDKAVADRVAAVMQQNDATLEIKVVEITQ